MDACVVRLRNLVKHLIGTGLYADLIRNTDPELYETLSNAVFDIDSMIRQEQDLAKLRYLEGADNEV